MFNYGYPFKVRINRRSLGASYAKGGVLGKRYRAPVVSVVRGAGSYARRRLRRRNIRTAGFLGIETKFHDKAVTASVQDAIADGMIDPAANSSSLFTPAQGDGESNRDGRKAVIKGIYIRGDVQGAVLSDVADVQLPLIVRVALVQDTQTNGAQMSASDCFLASTYPEHSFRNIQNAKRFKVLWDRTFHLQPAVTGTDGANTQTFTWQGKSFKIYKNVNIPVHFDGTTDDIANVTDNSLHMIAWGNADGKATITYNSRIRFVG